MAQEPPVSSLHMLKEVRIDIGSGIYDSTILFLLPPLPSLSFNRARRLIQKNQPALKTEEEFVERCLATESNVFFGRTGEFPRSVLWRILGNGCRLQIRSVDLSKSYERQPEAAHILEFMFPSPIRPGCVAIAEPPEENKLSVFALAASNDLYTLTLPKSFFYSSSASEGGIENWCKISKLSSLSFTTPHRFIAKNSSELILGRSDGTIARVTRKEEEKDLAWHEVTYNDGKWGSSLRSLVAWQGANSITFNGTTLEKSTPLALAIPPTDNHLWVVGLDHTLKVWNLESGRTVYKNDLLGIEREPHETAKLLLDPSNPNLIQIFDAEASPKGDHYYVMTYSPHELGQFKIWAVRDADAGGKGIRDMYPEAMFRAPDPDPSPDSKMIWKMVDFKVNITRNDGFNILILMKSNRQHQLYSLKVHFEDFAQDLHWHWQNRWVTTSLEALNSTPPPHTSDMEPEGITESWTKFLLDAGRFPNDLVDLALSRYAASQNLNVEDSSKATLQERVATTISSMVRLQPRKSGGMDFARYRTALEQEWVALWQDVQTLSNSRWEVTSLAFDDKTQVPWLSCSGGCSVVRTYSRTEQTKFNDANDLSRSQRLAELPSTEVSIENSTKHREEKPAMPEELSMLIATAARLKASFNADLRRTCELVLANELWQEPAFSAPLRIHSLYNRCRLDIEVSQEAFERMLSDLKLMTGNGKSSRSLNALFKALIEDLPAKRSAAQGLFYTRCGLQVTVTGAQEMIAFHKQFLSDLLLLVLVIEVDVKPEAERLQSFDVDCWFAKLTQLLKQYQILHWLATKHRAEPTDSTDGGDSDPTAGNDTPSRRTSTVLQNLFARYLAPQPYDRLPQIDTVLQDVENLLIWATGLNEKDVTFDDALTTIQGNLLLNNNIDLASSFVSYQPSTPFSTYLKGRLHLIKGDYTEAAIHFKKAAFNLSQATSVEYDLHSSFFLSPTEVAQLGHGLPAYYTHILTLYQAAECPSYVATFARLTLQLTSDPSVRSTSLQTVFHASLHTCDFHSAFSTLIRLPPTTAAPRITAFLTKLLAQNAFNTALTLPWPPTLRPHIDTFLSSKAAALPTSTGPQYHKLLASWRLHHLDHRGAAAALLAHLQRVRKSSRSSFAKPGDTDEVMATYLNVINLLACAGEKEEDDAWVLTDAFEGLTAGKGAPAKKKRKLVTVKDVRAAYQKELDRRSVLESGRWGFGLDGAGDEDEEMGQVEGEGMDVDGE